jgi:flagellar biosynthesis/type III secretory pathway chaperone
LPAADGAGDPQGFDRLSSNELGSLLVQTDELAQQLLGSLTEIRSALATANSADLVRILEKESAILTRLGEVGAAPGVVGAAATQPNGAASLEEQIRRVEPQGGPLLQRWQSLRATLQRCNAINRANAAAVAAMEQRVRLAISLLRQGSPEALAYGPAGMPLRQDLRRRVTRA